jgi:hypothetical protein
MQIVNFGGNISINIVQLSNTSEDAEPGLHWVQYSCYNTSNACCRRFWHEFSKWLRIWQPRPEDPDAVATTAAAKRSLRG